MALPFEVEGSYLLLFLFLLPLLLFIIKQSKFSSASNNSPKLPPGPTPWPVIGNILHMGKMPHITLSNYAKIYGPLMSLRLGIQCMVVGSSPAAATEILKIQDRILSARNIPQVIRASKELLNSSSIAMAEECSDRWKYLRTICRAELFCGKALESQEQLRERKTMELLEFLNVKEGHVVNIAELIFVTIFNMFSNLFFSRDLLSLEEESTSGGLKALVRESMEVAAAPNLSDFFPVLSKLDLQGLQKKAMKLKLSILANWEPIIEERRKNGTCTSQKDFLDCLLRNDFTNEQIHQLLMELFAAGTDTTTSTVEWAMAELVKSPETMQKVRQELQREVDLGFPKESYLIQLSYLQACVKETLRLHPPVPLLIPHRATGTCQAMGYEIPKNAQILVNVWAIGRDPSTWDEPLKFRPERFLNSGLDFNGTDLGFIPFGAGRRICPGQPMAARVVPLVLASLIHFFDWSLPHGKNPGQLDMNEKFGITLQKEQPLLLIAKARNNP